jgi:hypothetical protein
MKLDTANVATLIVAALSVVVGVIGGLVVLIHPETLSFKEYANVLKTFVIGVGLLAVGRGLAARKR